MKTAAVLMLILFAGISDSRAQSQSYQTLKNKFSASADVFSFRTSGFLSRAVLCMAGEREFKNAIKQVRSIRLITIPKAAFREKEVSLNGFRKIVRNDGFDELALLREDGNEISVYLQPARNSRMNRYLILIDDHEEVTALEIKGYIDPDILNKKDAKFL